MKNVFPVEKKNKTRSVAENNSRNVKRKKGYKTEKFAHPQCCTGYELKVTRPSFFWGGLLSYFEALWYPHLYFYRKSKT